MRWTFVFVSLLLSAGMVAARPSGMSDDCNAAYDEYLAETGPKAFAVAKNDACGWQSHARLAEAKKRAVAFCVAHGGEACKVVESEKK